MCFCKQVSLFQRLFCSTCHKNTKAYQMNIKKLSSVRKKNTSSVKKMAPKYSKLYRNCDNFARFNIAFELNKNGKYQPKFVNKMTKIK